MAEGSARKLTETQSRRGRVPRLITRQRVRLRIGSRCLLGPVDIRLVGVPGTMPRPLAGPQVKQRALE